MADVVFRIKIDLNIPTNILQSYIIQLVGNVKLSTYEPLFVSYVPVIMTVWKSLSDNTAPGM